MQFFFPVTFRPKVRGTLIRASIGPTFLFERVSNGDFFKTQIIYLRVRSIGGVVGFEANNWKHYRKNCRLFDTCS